jgi:hypothetical protein
MSNEDNGIGNCTPLYPAKTTSAGSKMFLQTKIGLKKRKRLRQVVKCFCKQKPG